MQITVNGAQLFVDIEGSSLVPDGKEMREKPVLVLVHGGPGGDHSTYKPFFSQFTDQAQVVYYDHRGNGRSTGNDPKDWTLDQWGDDLRTLIDALGFVKPIVLGTSFGGFVALNYATRYPDHPGALALISTAAHVDFNEVYTTFERLGGPEIRAIAQDYWQTPTDAGRALYRDHCVPFYAYHRDDQPADWLARVLWRNESALHFNGPGNEHGRMDMRADLHKITCPTLLMAGTEDPITPVAFSDTLQAGLSNAAVTYHRLENCGHGVTGDCPDIAAAAIRDLLTAQTP